MIHIESTAWQKNYGQRSKRQCGKKRRQKIGYESQKVGVGNVVDTL
jgi:hypothetical protein